MDKLEKALQKHAIYSPIKVHEAPIEDILKDYEVTKMAMGQMGRAYRVEKSKWILKESRWDLSLELFWNTRLPLPANITEKVLNFFSFTFRPREEEVLRQYRMYLSFVEYFGFFDEASEYYHPNINIIHTAQKSIRESLLYFKPKIEKKYAIKLSSKLDEILETDVMYHNFLPKEYLLFGKSISKENKGKDTQFIFQEFLEGALLHDVKRQKMEKRQLHELILMIYMLLLMHYQLGIIPDTRPRYVFTEAYNWLTKTDNVMMTQDGLKFIDTRWFWDSSWNIFKRGFIIPNMIINMSKLYLNYLLKNVE